MQVKILNELAKVPVRKRDGDAGFDVCSIESFTLKPNERHKFLLGIAIELNEDTVALVQGRSGLAVNKGITTIGNVIDSNYRGEISAILVNLGNEDFEVNVGDRIAQILILKINTDEFNEVSELSSTDRGSSGFGSTGIN